MVKDNLRYDDLIINIVRNISESKTTFYKSITFFASPYFLVSISVILLIVLKDKLVALMVPINLVVSALLNNIVLKLIFKRARPLDMLVEESGYSFPSGHSFVSIAFYGFLIYLIINSELKKQTKVVLSMVLASLISLIGISRIYLGVHYPSDVTAGFIGGTIYLMIFIEIVKVVKGEKYEKEK